MSNSTRKRKTLREKDKDLIKKRSSFLSQFEKEMLDKIAISDSVKQVAVMMQKSEGHLYQRLYRLRKKIGRARAFSKTVADYQKNSPRLRKLLTSAESEDGS
jgi:hypothetical protein